MSMNIPTNSAGHRYIYKCECKNHKNCDFSGDSIKPVIPECKGDCKSKYNSSCDSVQTISYNPNNITKEYLSNKKHGNILRKCIKEKEILKPLKEKLDL